MSEEWKRGEQDSVGLQCEYGSTGNVRFLDPGQVTMYNASGENVLCACGKPAGSAIMGKEAYIAFCGDCYHKFLSENHATFSYKEPVNPIPNNLLKDAWVVDMREGSENGDTDWYDPKLTPADGEPIYFKVEILAKGYYLPHCKLSNWMAESYEEKVVSWQKREDGKNYHDDKEPA